MEEHDFYIALNIKTADGFESYGKFFLGNNRGAAENIFAKLNGSKKVNSKSILTLELVETNRNLPVNIQVISCTLDELTKNTKIITKEMFKLLNLNEI
jgi:hypothetical protein